VKRFLGEDVSALSYDLVLEKFEEARVMRDFEVGVIQEAVAKAFGAK
jgi:hypothetical protein